jgi:predicted nucleic acid-binding protein
MKKPYVIDASVIAQYFLQEEFTPQVHALLSDVDQIGLLWLPELCLIEIGNVLWKQIRFNHMEPQEAVSIFQDLPGLPLNIVNVSGLLLRALEIGGDTQLPIYDAIYIALAEELHFPLMTVDRRQLLAASTVGIALKPVSDFSPSAS